MSTTKIAASNMISSDDFWQYSLEIYANDDVKTSLLQLQDNFHVNVNLVLFLMFASEKRLLLPKELLHDLQQSIDTLDNEVTAHRKKRKVLKTIDQEKYKQALKDELALEKRIQTKLVDVYANTKLSTTKGLDCPSGFQGVSVDNFLEGMEHLMVYKSPDSASFESNEFKLCVETLQQFIGK